MYHVEHCEIRLHSKREMESSVRRNFVASFYQLRLSTCVQPSSQGVLRATASFGNGPFDALVRCLDGAGLAAGGKQKNKCDIQKSEPQLYTFSKGGTEKELYKVQGWYALNAVLGVDDKFLS